jgi:putative transposase
MGRQRRHFSADFKARVALDNILVERHWRSVKWEEVSTHDDQTMQEAWRGLHDYVAYYIQERPHQALGYLTPVEVYFQHQPAIGSLSVSEPGSRIGVR